MDWTKGYSAMYYVSILDKDTLRDIDRIEITDGTIKRTMTDLRESADLTCVNYPYTTEKFIRVWLDAKQDGASSHTPLFTGIATSPQKDINGRYITNTLECYSILKIAADILLPPGWYAPTETDGTILVKELLSVIGTNIDIAPSDEESRRLTQAIIAESGETRLSMADAILDAIHWRMIIDGYGNIRLEQYASEPAMTFSPSHNDILETAISFTYDWFNCPNVFRAISDELYATAIDEDPDSPYSTVSRGREVWAEETSCELNTDETIAAYAQRRLTELQQAATEISYDRRYIPELKPTDSVMINYPEQGISGTFLITEQSISLGYNAKTSEEVVRYGI